MGAFCSCFKGPREETQDDDDDCPSFLDLYNVTEHTLIWPRPNTSPSTNSESVPSFAISDRADENAESDAMPLSTPASSQLVNDEAATKQSGEGGKLTSSNVDGKALSFPNQASEVERSYVVLDDVDEDVCPTCLEEYTKENPKITANCSHGFHLACILSWLERCEYCPVCSKVMIFKEMSE